MFSTHQTALTAAPGSNPGYLRDRIHYIIRYCNGSRGTTGYLPRQTWVRWDRTAPPQTLGTWWSRPWKRHRYLIRKILKPMDTSLTIKITFSFHLNHRKNVRIRQKDTDPGSATLADIKKFKDEYSSSPAPYTCTTSSWLLVSAQFSARNLLAIL